MTARQPPTGPLDRGSRYAKVTGQMSADIPARCPQPPRKVRRVLAHFFPAGIRLPHLRQTGHLHQRHEAESGSLALRLAGLLPRFPPGELLRLAPVQLRVRMSNL